jgi:aarF domain-containing kinase
MNKVNFRAFKISSSIKNIIGLPKSSNNKTFYKRSIIFAGILVSTNLNKSHCESNIYLNKNTLCNNNNNNEQLIETNKPIISKIYNILSKCINNINNTILVIYRSLYHLICFTPSILTLPTLLFNSNYDWWFEILKHNVRNSGPCTIKLCQWIATRPDLFPIYLCNHLQDLQSNGYTIQNLPDIEESLTNSLGSDWRDYLLLKGFDKGIIKNDYSLSILGTGSVAMVLYGNLLTDNNCKEVAVKIIHPNVKNEIKSDIKILYFLSNALSCIPGMENFSLNDIVHDFEKLMLSQLDLNKEAKNLLLFRKNFHNKSSSTSSNDTDALITFPEPMFPLVTENVLIESFESGIINGYF